MMDTNATTAGNPIVGGDLTRLLPSVLPVGWVRHWLDETTVAFQIGSRSGGVAVLVSAGIEQDGRRWLHLSVSLRGGAMPDWYMLREIKDMFAGREALALQVFPPAAEHYTMPAPGAPDVAHLWVCLDARPVPDFLAWRGGTL